MGKYSIVRSVPLQEKSLADYMKAPFAQIIEQ